ncbi:MAG TPA: response regulator [Tahibacter sp.]|nr:response regulator [Tahibacter sp.]
MINDAYVSDIVEQLAHLAAEVLDHDARTPLDRAVVADVLQTMEANSAAHGLRGLTYLFRMLHKLPIAWPAAAPAAADRDRFDGWIADCCGYVLGSDTRGCERLVDAPLSLSFVPPLAPRARELLVAALADDAPKLERAAARRNVVVAGLNATLDVGTEPAAIAAEAFPAPGAPVGIAAATVYGEPVDTGETPAYDDTATSCIAVAAADAPTWVSAEELALIHDAVETQLLPAVSVALEQHDAPRSLQIEAIDACLDQLGLIESAVDALALAGLQQACAGYRRLVERLRDDTSFSPDIVQGVGLWPVLLLGHLQDPHDMGLAADLVETLDERGVLAADEAAALRAVLGAVSIGVDPAQQQARKRVAEPDDVALDIADDVLPSVLAGMLQELPGRSAEFSACVQRYARDRTVADLDNAQRIAHTLKGDGNIVGLRGIANLTHALEEILSALAATPERASDAIAELLIDAADCLESMSDHVLGHGPPPEHAVADLQRVYDVANALHEGVEPASAIAAAEPTQTVDDPGADAAPAPTPAESEPATTIAVPMRLLDDLLRLTGEAVIHARQVEDRVTRMERRHDDIGIQGTTFQTLIAELQQLVEVRGAALDTLRLDEEFDDLELDRYNELHTVTLRLVEASADTRASAGELDDDVLQLRDLLSQQDRVQVELREHVMQARQVAAREISPRLQRVVRQTSRQLGKPCELHIDGDDVALDKDIVDTLAEPLLHVLRNAIDHGLEIPEHRVALGKPALGRIDLSFRREAGTLVVNCRDDGAGLDTDAIRLRAIERGLIAPDAELGEEELAALVLRSGFSTRQVATLTSGRGIGMDIVHHRVTALKGVLNLHSRRGRGCDIEFRLPLSQVAAQVLLVEAAYSSVAVNLDGIVRTIAIAAEDLVVRDGAVRLRVDDMELPAVPLEALLGFDASPHHDARATRALLVAGDDRAVVVDGVRDARAVIVKNLGPHVPPNPGLLGATILGDGTIAPVVDLPQLIRRHTQTATQIPFADAQAVSAPTVLIVDDSLSARRSLEQLIGDAGFRVVAARDGLEALERVATQRPDLMIVDLEMPRMNGLELTSFVRKGDATQAIPIIMITSRTTERHRELARSAGVDVTLGKPYSEDRLLALIADFLQRGRAAA